MVQDKKSPDGKVNKGNGDTAPGDIQQWKADEIGQKSASLCRRHIVLSAIFNKIAAYGSV